MNWLFNKFFEWLTKKFWPICLLVALAGLVSCAPTVNGGWMVLHQTVETCPTPNA